MSEKNRAVFFDLDGTLTLKHSTWQFLHSKLKTEIQAKKHSALYYNRDISYSKWGILDAKLWKGTKTEKICEILSSIPVVEEVENTIYELQKRGFYNCVITSSLSLFADKVSEDYHFDKCIANILESRNGLTTGHVEMIVTDENKGIHVENICDELCINPEMCVAIGDSQFDIDMFKAVGFAIAFNPNDQLIKEKADKTINSKTMMDIIPPIDRWILNKTDSCLSII